MDKSAIERILIPALRQYQHNDCSGLIHAFDYEETIKIVTNLQYKLLKYNLCPHCGEELNEDDKIDVFCENCGWPFGKDF